MYTHSGASGCGAVVAGGALSEDLTARLPGKLGRSHRVVQILDAWTHSVPPRDKCARLGKTSSLRKGQRPAIPPKRVEIGGYLLSRRQFPF
jgi:hypothetical protein